MGDRRAIIRGFQNQWIGTPYLAGQQLIGVGVDCIRLVKAWGEACFPGRIANLPPAAQDAALHSPRISASVRQCLREAFQAELVSIEEVQPGDVIGVSRKDNPFHVGIICENPLQVLHAEKQRSEVLVTSLQALMCDGFKVREVYRFGFSS